MQAGITKIRYNNAGQLDHNVGRFKIGIRFDNINIKVLNHIDNLVNNNSLISKDSQSDLEVIREIFPYIRKEKIQSRFT